MKFRSLATLPILISLLSFSCSSSGERLDTDSDLVSDSGGLTRTEMEKAANQFGGKIGTYFKENPAPGGIFVAFLPTKNDTSEMIPTDFFDRQFVSTLLKNRVFTVRVDKREKSLKEIQFSQSGLTRNQLNPGNMTSPNFYVDCVIREDMFMSGGKRIVEQTIDVQLIDVETQIAVWSERAAYRKKAASRGGVGW